MSYLYNLCVILVVFFMKSAKIIVYVTHVDETMQRLIIEVEKLKT